MINQLEIKTGIENMDLAAIHHFLQNDSYWAKGIAFELVKASLGGEAAQADTEYARCA